jgi:hypothetical protein
MYRRFDQVSGPVTAFVLNVAASPRLGAAVELDLSLGDFSQHGHAVLNAQPLDFAVPKVLTKTDKFAPRRRQPVVSLGGYRFWRCSVGIHHKRALVNHTLEPDQSFM